MVALKGTLHDTFIEVGLKLLPVLTPLLQQFGSFASDVLPKVVDVVQKRLIPVLAPVASLLGSIADAGIGSNEMWEALSGLLGEDLTNALKNVTDRASAFFGQFQNPDLQAQIQRLMDTLAPLVRDVLEKMAPVLDDIVSKIGELTAQAAPVVLDNIQSALDGISTWWNGPGGESFRTIVGWIGKLVAASAVGSIELLTGLIAALININTDPAQALQDITRSLHGFANSISSVFGKTWDEVWGSVMGDLELAKIIFGAVGDRISKTIGKALDGINTAIHDFYGWIKKVADQLKHLVIPDFLQHHSPTPLAMAFKEIGKEIKTVVASNTLPAFAGQMKGLSGGDTYDYSKKLEVGALNINNGRQEEAMLQLLRNAAGV